MMRSSKHWLAGIAVAVSLSLSPPAGAQASKEQARTLFDAGVNAYKQGQFLTAAQAFIKAHRLLPKPQLLFSIAQAFKREFDDNQQKQPLVMAVKYYRLYLDEVKDGGRKLEAVKALGDLKPYLQTIGGDASGEMVFPTRLSVNSPTPGAVVRLDDGAVHPLPWNTQIKPGQHTIVLEASGYVSESKTFDAKQGDILPFAIPLKGKPPTLAIDGATGAEVTVDGKLLGTAPFSQPLELTPGRHFVAVTSRGYKAYAEEITFEYGGKTTISIDLPMTDQRRWAWGVLAAGGAGLVAAGVLAGIALIEESNAKEIAARQKDGSISTDDLISHNDSLTTRDGLALAAGIAAGAGGAVAITGLFLFFFDDPVVRPPLSRDDEGDEGGDQADPIEVVARPIVGPGQYGVAIGGRF